MMAAASFLIAWWWLTRATGLFFSEGMSVAEFAIRAAVALAFASASVGLWRLANLARRIWIACTALLAATSVVILIAFMSIGLCT